MKRISKRTGSWLPAAVLAMAVIGVLATPCLAYGGWNYADPHGQTLWVLQRLASYCLPWLVLPYAVFVAITWRWGPGHRDVLTAMTLAFALWLMFAVGPIATVMGERGPAHLMSDIGMRMIGVVFALAVVRVAVTYALGAAGEKRHRLIRRAPLALAAVEVVMIAALLLSPLAWAPAQMARDGSRKCKSFRMDSAAREINDVRKESGAWPAKLSDLPSYTDQPALLQCPVSHQFYVYQLDTVTGGYTLTCPTHGHVKAVK
jgi:hypothetical protein